MSFYLGCHLLGEFLHLVREDFKKAYQVFDYTCREYNYFKSCNSLGVFTFQGKGIKKPDIKKSFPYFKKACEQGSAEGCYHYGQLASGSDPKVVDAGVKPDPKASIEALEKGCELGCPDACFAASSSYTFGENEIEKDEVKGFNLAKRGCEEYMHFESCNNLLIMYQKGIGTKKDLKAAKEVQVKVDDYVEALQKKRNVSDMQRGAD